MLSHRNVCYSAYNLALTVKGVCDENDVCLSYLPLAHILAFAFEVASFALGMTIGYGVRVSPPSPPNLFVFNYNLHGVKDAPSCPG